MSTRTRSLVGAVIAGTLVVSGAGTAYAAHFQDRALPGSSVGGASVAGLTRAEVAEAVRSRAAGVTVTVASGSDTAALRLADLGYDVDVEATVAGVFDANGRWASYATSLVSRRDVDAVVRVDTERTAEVVAGLVAAAGRSARDAAVVLAPGKASFVVTPAVSGKTVTRSSFHDVVERAARDLASATATIELVDADPTVSTEAAEQVAAQANALVERTVEVSDGEDTLSASGRTKASWVAIPTVDGVPGTPTLDAAKVRAWVDDVAEKVASDPVDGVRHVSTTGTVLLVTKEARDGADVTDAPAVAEALTATLTSGKDFSGTFSMKSRPATWTDREVAPGAEGLAYPATRGEKWIDVDLSAHTMTAYVGATRVYGPVKMVHGSDEKPTITGTFQVYLKRQVQTMRGDNADGTRYETPDVPWISYFHRGFALHGAPWRSSFGYAGDRGSHGCVNLPVSVAKWVYDFAPVGTTVRSHY
ncbi:L,D-transpeptidase [Oryzobacter sp. R7]|uniref:L,D-transpeptidase n=1 Tax=Oryzobacter faecalis TaxID=3388656 RepID=UPI00398D104E